MGDGVLRGAAVSCSRITAAVATVTTCDACVRERRRPGVHAACSHYGAWGARVGGAQSATNVAGCGGGRWVRSRGGARPWDAERWAVVGVAGSAESGRVPAVAASAPHLSVAGAALAHAGGDRGPTPLAVAAGCRAAGAGAAGDCGGRAVGVVVVGA